MGLGYMKILMTLLSLVFLVSCKDTLPKPKAYLRLSYPDAQYKNYTSCNYSFDINTLGETEQKKCDVKVVYPKMKATVYLTYKPVEGNLNTLLKDAQKLTYEHVIKADEITEQIYQNPDKKVYGMLYRLGGNAATNTQFYLTDSTDNFVVGSVYFYSKPNYDSILPAAKYIENDVSRLIESLSWGE